MHLLKCNSFSFFCVEEKVTMQPFFYYLEEETTMQAWFVRKGEKEMQCNTSFFFFLDVLATVRACCIEETQKRKMLLLLLLATTLRIRSFLLVALCLDYFVFLLQCFFSFLVCILCDV